VLLRLTSHRIERSLDLRILKGFHVNKAQLIDKLSTQLGSKKAASDAVDAVVDTITRTVASGERVAITGFGVFDKVARPARVGRNPRTGAAVKIKKTTVPKFKAGQGFKDVVSGAKKLPKVAVSAARTVTGTAAPAKKTTARKTTARKTTAKKAPARKSTATKSTATKSAAGRTLATKSPAKSAATKKSAAKKLATKKTTAKKTTARKR
jgi:DNA-binding protein HU-beta